MRFLIIGNGVAGNEVADTLRDESPEAEIVIVSAENHPEYSACALSDCLAGWAPREKLFIKSLSQYEERGIELLLGTKAEKIVRSEKKVLLSDGETLSYDKLFLATGSRAFVPPVSGSSLPGNYVLKSMDDMDNLERSKAEKVVVIGSGNIGIEAAEAMEIRGAEVTVIELLDRIMPKIFDEKASRFLESKIKEQGIEILCSEKVEEILGTDKVEGVRTDKRELACDTVIWAVGVRQNSEIAADAGLQLGDLGGIKVDAGMHTNDPDIFACGDCIETFDLLTGEPTLSLLWPSARQQAKVAALNALGFEAEYEGAFSVVMEDICGIPAVSLGKTMESAEQEKLLVLEDENSEGYYCIILEEDTFVGYQNIGRPEGAGSIMFMIKNRKTMSELKGVLNNKELAKRMPHYIVAGRLSGIN